MKSRADVGGTWTLNVKTYERLLNILSGMAILPAYCHMISGDIGWYFIDLKRMKNKVWVWIWDLKWHTMLFIIFYKILHFYLLQSLDCNHARIPPSIILRHYASSSLLCWVGGFIWMIKWITCSWANETVTEYTQDKFCALNVISSADSSLHRMWEGLALLYCR